MNSYTSRLTGATKDAPTAFAGRCDEGKLSHTIQIFQAIIAGRIQTAGWKLSKYE
jgi:hypothetical protein